MTSMSNGQPGTGTLVCYASKMGSTREIAEAIGAALGDTGQRVTVLPVDEVSDLTPYGMVVLGSAVYLNRWRPEAVHFLKRHRDELAGREVWLFQSGPCGERDASKQLPLPPKVQRLAAQIGARPPVTFGGRLEPATARGPVARWLARGELAGDWRNWDQIRAWVARIADQGVRHG